MEGSQLGYDILPGFVDLSKKQVDYIKTDTDDKFLETIISRPAERVHRLQPKLVD